MIIAAFLIAAAVTAGIVMLLRRSSFAQAALDHPNHRSLHEQPIPRVGGVSMAGAVAITIAILNPVNLPVALLFAAASLCLASLLDDRMNLPVLLRLAFHLLAAATITSIWFQGSLAPLPADDATSIGGGLSFWAAAATMLALCWLTNLFNFMDGADGMAGGMALIGFGTYTIAALAIPAHGQLIAVVAATLSGAALGFLLFNFPPASVFMGDAGSVPIGFLAAALGIHGYLLGLWPWWFGALVFSPFIVDATVTLIKRLVRGERIWVAHREHYYQRLILSGWSHRRTVFSYYLLMLGSAISALAAQNSQLLYPTLTFWVITYSSLLLYLEWRFHQHKKD